ncbi:MAG: arsenic resistance protein [Pseudomonadota bacterium]
MLTGSLRKSADFMSGRGTPIILIAAILFGAAVGIASPEAGDFVSGQIDYTILALVVLLLFDVRIQSVVASFGRVPFLIAALIANFVIIPALGFAIASVVLPGQPIFFIGLLIYFMAPCTDWFLGFTRLADGNTALGAALLPINMIVQLLLYPVYLYLFGVESLGVSAETIFQSLWLWFLVPLVVAVVARFLIERLLNEKQFEIVSDLVAFAVPVLLAILVWQIAAAHIGTLIANAAVFPLILLGIFAFFVATFFLAEGISKLMKLSHEDRVLMTMTTAARNAPLMLVVTMAVIPDQPLIYAAIVIGMLVELPHLIALKSVLKRQGDALKAAQGSAVA